MSLPFITHFEENDISKLNWTIENSSSTLIWKLSNEGKLSSHSIYANTDGSTNDTTTFSSNVVNFSNSDIPAITFDLTYNREELASNDDQFILSYEKACDDKWITIKSFTKEEITTVLNQGTNYTPFETDWKN